MISRAHGLVLALLLGAATATGAYALIATAHLGDGETKPEAVSSRQIEQRAKKLDAWEASLLKTMKARPPALPRLNRYAAVTFVAAPGAAPLPAPAPAASRSLQQADPVATPAAKPKVKPKVKPAAKAAPKQVAPVAKPVRDEGDEKDASKVPVAAPPPSAPAPAVVVAAADPSPPAAPAAPAAQAPSATLSVEQQCRQLLRAAESKGEQAKQEAERQCEALKQAAERTRRG